MFTIRKFPSPRHGNHIRILILVNQSSVALAAKPASATTTI